jgi:hypothetical protein
MECSRLINTILKIFFCTLPDPVHGGPVDIKFFSQARKNSMGKNDTLLLCRGYFDQIANFAVL